MRSVCVLAALLVLPAGLVAEPPAPPSVLEVIPREASAALVVRSIDAFKTKGKKLLEELDLKAPISPEDLVPEALKLLNITGGIDEKAPVVLTILQGKDGAAAGLDDIVLLLPVADRDKALAGFGVDRKPKDDEIVPVTPGGIVSPKALTVRGRYLCLGMSEDVLKRLTMKPLAGISAAEKKQYGDSDLLLYLGERAWPFVWGDYLDSLNNYFTRRKFGLEEKVGKQFVYGMRDAKYSLVGLHLDKGARLQSTIVFDVKKDEAAKEMLGMLRAGANRATTGALADGNVVAALGWAGNGSKNGIITKLIFDVFLEGPLPGKLNDLPVFARADYPTAAGVTHELWKGLRGARLGLYQHKKEAEVGLFSVVAILDAGDAPAFVREVRSLATIAELKEEDLKKDEVKKIIDVEKLVRQLDDDEFEARESATTRLRLLGVPALPYLEKAIEKPISPEQARRAKELRDQIAKIAEEKRKELLLAKDLPRSIRPEFAFVPAMEKRGGVTVDGLKLTLTGGTADLPKLAERLLGPSWDRVRLAVVGEQVVVLIGSATEHLDATLANLKTGKGGLAQGKLLTGFDRRADRARTAEMHGSAQAFLGMVASTWNLPETLFRDPPELTSFATSFEEDRLHLDLWVPTRELRVMLHAIFPGS